MKIRRRKIASGVIPAAGPYVGPVTDPDLDAPDGAIVDGAERVGDNWVPASESSPRGDVASFLDHASRSATRSPRSRKNDLERAIEDAERRAASGEWDEATGRSFVGLYALCHRIVYGVPPEELTEKGPLALAAKMATTCLHTHFQDDRAAFVEFIKWTWEREKSRELWALQNGKQRNRLGVRLQFSGSLITDHRVDLSRRRKSRGRS